MSRVRFVQVYDGEWFQPRKRGHLMKCCDCGLVHRTDFRVKESTRGLHIQMRATRLTKRGKK
jgi:hypothetical protein